MNKLMSIKSRQLILYLLISVLATAVDLGLFLLLLNVFDWHYLFANIFSITFGILTKFSLNKLITFKDRIGKTWQQQFQRFIIVSGSGFVLSNLVLAVLIEIFRIDELISKIFGMGVVFAYTFVLHNFYSFK